MYHWFIYFYSHGRKTWPGFGFVVEGTFPPAEKDYDYDDLERCHGRAMGPNGHERWGSHSYDDFGFITHDGSMVLPYMVTWIPSIYPSHVSIYTSTMDPMGKGYNVNPALINHGLLIRVVLLQ